MKYDLEFDIVENELLERNNKVLARPRFSLPFKNKITVYDTNFIVDSKLFEQGDYYNIDISNFPSLSEYTDQTNFPYGVIYEYDSSNIEYRYYDIVNNTLSELLDNTNGIKIIMNYINRNILLSKPSSTNSSDKSVLDFSSNALIILESEVTDNFYLNNTIVGIHTKPILQENNTSNELSYAISSRNTNTFEDSNKLIINSNVESSTLEFIGITDEINSNNIVYTLDIRNIASDTSYNQYISYNKSNSNNIKFKQIKVGYNHDIDISNIKIYELKEYIPGTHIIEIFNEHNILTETSSYMKDIIDINDISKLDPTPLVEFGSSLDGLVYQEESYGFKLEIKFKDNNNDQNSAPFLFYISNNEESIPSSNFIDSSNAFYIIKRNASGRMGKQYIINMPGLSYVDILTPIISSSNFETTYNTIIIEVSNNNVDITTSVNSDKLRLSFLNNDQYTGLINDHIFNRLWVGYNLNVDVEYLKINMLI